MLHIRPDLLQQLRAILQRQASNDLELAHPGVQVGQRRIAHAGCVLRGAVLLAARGVAWRAATASICCAPSSSMLALMLKSASLRWMLRSASATA